MFLSYYYHLDLFFANYICFFIPLFFFGVDCWFNLFVYQQRLYAPQQFVYTVFLPSAPFTAIHCVPRAALLITSTGLCVRLISRAANIPLPSIV